MRLEVLEDFADLDSLPNTTETGAMMKLIPKIATFVLLTGLANSSDAQMVVSGARTIIVAPPAAVVQSKTIVKMRRTRRDRNPYYVARPNYAPTVPGARANITFEPFTRWYYPNQNSYYPPLVNDPSIRSR